MAEQSNLPKKSLANSRRKNFFVSARERMRKNPLFVFLGIILLLLITLSVGKAFQTTKQEQSPQEVTKQVKVYSIGNGSLATFQAKVEKNGVVQIMAQSAGVVQYINKKEGQKINQGEQVISLSTNYQGGSAPGVQRQIAQTQYQNVLDTYATQSALIKDQRDVANETYNNAQRLRDIQRSSTANTNKTLDSAQSQLSDLSSNLDTTQQNNQNNKPIQIIKGLVDQAQSGLNQLKDQQQASNYQTSDNEPPAKLSELQKNITQKQLDIQEKSLQLNKEVSRLQVQLAGVNEALMYPASPFFGTVQKVFVKKGQLVNPGTVIATVASNTIDTTATVLVPQNVAQALAQGQQSKLQIGSKSINATPYYVSNEATDGQLYSVYFTIPQDLQQQLNDSEYISVQLPLNTSDKDTFEPIIPIDAIYQSQTDTSVLVVDGNVAKTKNVIIDEVVGDYVKVTKGLTNNDQVILNRNIIAGDKVKVQ